MSAAAEIVELERVARGTVDESRLRRGQLLRAAPQDARSAGAFERVLHRVPHNAGDVGVRACDARGERVDEKTLRQPHRVGRQVLVTRLRPVLREAFGERGHSTVSPIALMSLL
jgi:hypothetical protein